MNEVYIDESSFRRRYQYTNTDLLGEGGFAQVYKAFDNQFQEHVALKFYNKGEQGKYDVLHEILKGRGFSHKNIIRVHDAVTVKFDNGGTSTFTQVGVLEFANGGNIRDFIKAKPTEEQFASVLKGILSALQYLHGEKSIIHRDLSPENILMVVEDNNWVSRIADFGISKKVDTSDLANKPQATQLLGKVEYMAPEQFNPDKYAIGGRISTNVDLWSFGIILYEIFANSKPFASHEGNMMMQIQAICEDPLPDLKEVPQPYRDMIKMCLTKDANKRVKTANELIAILDNGRANVTSGEAKTQPITQFKATPPKPRKKEKNSKVLIGIALGVGIPVLAVIGYLLLKKDGGEITNIPKQDSLTVTVDTLLQKPSQKPIADKSTTPGTTDNIPTKAEQVKALIEQGNLLFKDNNYTLAANKFTEILTIDPGNKVASAKLKQIDQLLRPNQQNQIVTQITPDPPADKNEFSVTYSTSVKDLKIRGVSIKSNQTVVNMELKPSQGKVRIFPPNSKGAFYVTYRDRSDQEKRVPLRQVDGISTEQEVAVSNTKVIKLIFDKLPEDVSIFNLIEGEDQIDEEQNYWNFYDVKIKK